MEILKSKPKTQILFFFERAKLRLHSIEDPGKNDLILIIEDFKILIIRKSVCMRYLRFPKKLFNPFLKIGSGEFPGIQG